MKKIQCTFRLPEKVVEHIEKQDGETRTDKLLSLLGFSSTSVDYGVIHNVISPELELRLQGIEARIYSLENEKLAKPMSSRNQANEARKIEAIEKLNAELDKIPTSDYKAIRNSRYPLSEVRKRTLITKSQCDSYKDNIFKRLGL